MKKYARPILFRWVFSDENTLQVSKIIPPVMLLVPSYYLGKIPSLVCEMPSLWSNEL